jgi:hypothetical protein
MSSAAKAELGALYINACKAVPMCQLLKKMGHKQPKTPIKTDNSTAFGVVNNNIQPQCTKAMDMRFHWLRCHESQNQFRYYWQPRTNNRANYWTKHHCAAHYIKSARKFSLQNSYSTPYECHLTEHQQLWAKVSSKQQMLPLLHYPTSTANQMY